MNYTVNLGCWGSIFAVPTDIVDKYLKIAGSAQLKVLLYILRHSADGFSDEGLASVLNMDVFDVRDCIEFWSSFGVLNVSGGVITPAASAQSAPAFSSPPADFTKTAPEIKPKSAPAPQTRRNTDTQPIQPPYPTKAADTSPSSSPEPVQPAQKEKPSETVVARPLRPDPIYVAKRISEDKEMEDLLNEAQFILGRPVSPNENAGLIMLHDNDGLPCEVILMLLSYGTSNQKGMRQIEAMGAAWAKEGILTLEQADEKIRQLEESGEAYRKVQTLLGLKYRKASKAEESMYTAWVNEWKMSDELIKEAYDICIDNKREFIPKYVNTVLKNWHEAGVKTAEQARMQSRRISSSGSDSGGSTRGSSFDIDELSSLSRFND